MVSAIDSCRQKLLVVTFGWAHAWLARLFEVSSLHMCVPDHLLESNEMVTGPSLSSDTFM